MASGSKSLRESRIILKDQLHHFVPKEISNVNVARITDCEPYGIVEADSRYYARHDASTQDYLPQNGSP